MADETEVQRFVPYESASELRDANSRLLDAYDHALEKDSSAEGDTAALRAIERDVNEFLKRGVATGAYIEETKERTGCQVLLDYWVSSLSRIGAALSGVRLAHFDGEQLPDLKDKPCPYVGLEAFRDKKFFFGRDADTEALSAQVRDSPLVIVFGASGSGKSSLVMGGVLPALAAKDNRTPLRIVPTLVPGNAVLRNLAEAVTQACAAAGTGVDNATEQFRADAGHLWSMVGGAGAPPTLIVIDQFEEVFTLSEIADRDALVANLARLLDSPQGHRVILTMREEFRSRMVELEGFKKLIDRAWYSMRPMGYEELKAAVEQPAAMVNLQYQSGIVDDLVKKVLGQPAALPLLQFTLRSLWDKRDRNRITWEVYKKVGDPLSALKTSADQFYEGLAPQTQDEVRRILLELVRVDELLEAYRQPVPKSRLIGAGKANTDEVLKLLANNDYVRITAGKSDSDSVVEVKHESLVRNWPSFVGWIDEKRVERRRRLALSEAAGRWEKSGRPTEGLLTGWQLEEAAQFTDLSALEIEFLVASREGVNRQLREKEAALQREAEQAKAAQKKAEELALKERAAKFSMRGALVVVVLAAIAISAAALYFLLRSNALTDRAMMLEKMAREQRMQAREQAERLANENYALQRAYNELFAKQVGLAVAPDSHLPSSQPVTIYLHISAAAQRPQAMELVRQLKENNINVPGVDIVTPVTKSDVRYFREEDRVGAEEIAKLLDKYLGVDVDINPRLVKGFEQKVPGRRYGIWFSPDAFLGSKRTASSVAAAQRDADAEISKKESKESDSGAVKRGSLTVKVQVIESEKDKAPKPAVKATVQIQGGGNDPRDTNDEGTVRFSGLVAGTVNLQIMVVGAATCRLSGIAVSDGEQTIRVQVEKDKCTGLK